MDSSDFDAIVQSEAASMAIFINGGDWNKDYTEDQKVGWCKKVEWAAKRYCGIEVHDIVVMYGDTSHKSEKPPHGLIGSHFKEQSDD